MNQENLRIAREAEAIRSQEKEIKNRNGELVVKAMSRAIANGDKPGFIGRIAANSLDKKLKQTHSDLAETHTRAQEHYQDNPEAYHQIALDEARTAGKEIDFGGQVATNVEKEQPANQPPTQTPPPQLVK